ncbi:MAG TPA: hypothetical protein VIM30_10195 [Candidatus Limnocylindrales bacterium]|jgi:hypothetical protein
MHQQIRVNPAKSPADLAGVLRALTPFNILAAGGSDVEHGGEFAFAVDHSQMDAASQALKNAGYNPRTVDVYHEFVPNQPGALAGVVARWAAANRQSGKMIKDIAVGAAGADGKVPVQIYAE